MPDNLASISPISVRPQDNVLQNFSDATAGRSLQLYWGVGTTDSTGESFLLVRDQSFSDPITKEGADTVATGEQYNIDFDITINKPTIFAGIASIDAKWFIKGGAAANIRDVTGYTKFEIFHYDGSTETSIGTVTTETLFSAPDMNEKIPYRVKLQISITRKLFAIGDILRITVLGFKTIHTSGNGTIWGISLDPETAGDEFKVWMPIVNLEGS